MSDKVFCNTSGITLIVLRRIPMELEAEVGSGTGPVWGQISPALPAWSGETQVTSGLAAGEPDPAQPRLARWPFWRRQGLNLAATSAHADCRAMPVT